MTRDNKVAGRNPNGPQEEQADLPENKSPSGRPQFYECGICGNCHPINWNGDCRDDNNRFTVNELEDKYGSENGGHGPDDGFEMLPMPGSEIEDEEEVCETCGEKMKIRMEECPPGSGALEQVSYCPECDED